MRHVVSLFVILSFVCITGSSAQIAHNQGTQVWLVPAGGGDLLRMVKEPLLSQRGLARIDVFGFYGGDLYDVPDFVCGAACGPNTFAALRDAVPGGMFKWLQDQGIKLAVEGGAVKPFACHVQDVRDFTLTPALNELKNVQSTGASISYFSIDESFAAGMGSPDYPQGQLGFPPCGTTAEETAQLLKVFVDGVHEKYPEVQVGFIEPYPFFSVDQLMTNLLELEHAGVPIPFLHVDLDTRAVRNKHADVNGDMQRLHRFCTARGIPLGIIVIGDDCATNGEFASRAWTHLRVNVAAAGVTEHTVFESWVIDVKNPDGPRHIPDLVPDTVPTTHLGQVLGMLQYLKVQPAQ